MKDLFKHGRKLCEYLNKNGTLKIDCISCVHRPSINNNLSLWLCGDGDRFKKCNPNYNYENDWKLDFLLWKPRVNYNTFVKEEDFNV